MAISPLEQWLLVATFVLTGAYCVARCAHFARTGRRHPASAWVTEVAHLAMSASMVGMVWAPRWDRWSVQLTLFAVVAGWFAARFLVGPPTGQGRTASPNRPVLLYEAIAFGAMCWMCARMTGPAAMSMSMAGPTPTLTARPYAVTWTTVGLVAALAVGAGTWAWQLRRAVAAGIGSAGTTGRPSASKARSMLFGSAGEAAGQIAMAAGMAIALAAMV